MNSIQNMAVHYQKNSPYEGFLHNLKEKRLEDIWKDNFKSSVQSLNQKSTMTWTNQNNNEETTEVQMSEEEENKKELKIEVPETQTSEALLSPPQEEKEEEPSHHARRPMNAFLIFCKKHRPIVRKKYPNLENRGVTRILGEWWAVLDASDKDAYTNLAKEYKDAFFTANPNFKWYKLPAPPLRPNVTPPKPAIILKDPINYPQNQDQVRESQFTPGKLADESQLGLLSSLLNPRVNQIQVQTVKKEERQVQAVENKAEENITDIPTTPEQNNNNTEPVAKPEALQETKPLKKRKLDATVDAKPSLDNAEPETKGFTQQNLVEQVVDKIYLEKKPVNKTKHKETRTSGRSCKGKRYAEFMKNGKLLKNKREKRSVDDSFDSPDSDRETKNDYIEIVPLENTIKRLAERTKASESIVPEPTMETGASTFNLELRIEELPSLSYEMFVQRKKDTRKRKPLKKIHHRPRGEVVVEEKMIGSRKRKNKQNITHLHQGNKVTNSSCSATNAVQGITENSDLSMLATLAEIAANTQKIDQL